MTEYSVYNELPTFRILFLNLYDRPFIEYHVNEIESERVDELLKSGKLFTTANVLTSDANRNQADLVWTLSDCLYRALFDALVVLSIPSEAQTLPLVYTVESTTFDASKFDSLLESFRQDLEIIVAVGTSEILNSLSSAQIIPYRLDAQIPQNESLQLFKMIWQKVGEFCLRREYITETQLKEFFSVEGVEECIRTNGLRYLSRNGEHLDQPDSGAFIIVPKFQPVLVEIVE